MKIIDGSLCSVGGGRGAVIGRLVLYDCTLGNVGAERLPILCLTASGASDDLLLSLVMNEAGKGDAVAIVLFTEPSLSLPRFPTELPVIAVSYEKECLIRSCRGDTAFIDLSCGTLIICPDLKALNRLSRRNFYEPIERSKLFGGADPTLSFLSLDDMLPSLRGGLFERSGCVIDLSNGGIESVSDTFSCEEDIFLYLRSVAERYPYRRFAVNLDYPEDEDSRMRFDLSVRALLRAAVYGDFILICGGIYYPTQAISINRRISRLFGDLESEGREANGFIMRAIRLTPPLVSFLSAHRTDLGASVSGTGCNELLGGFDILFVGVEQFIPSLKMDVRSAYCEIVTFLASLCQHFSELRIVVNNASEARVLSSFFAAFLDVGDGASVMSDRKSKASAGARISLEKSKLLEKLTEIYAPAEAYGLLMGEDRP